MQQSSAIFLTKDFEPVDKDDPRVYMVKIRDKDGKIIFAHKKEKVFQQGGPGSGNFGHAGRPGQVGGSAPGKPKSEESFEEFMARRFAGRDDEEFQKDKITVTDEKKVAIRFKRFQATAHHPLEDNQTASDFAASIYNYIDEETGIRAIVTDVYANDMDDQGEPLPPFVTMKGRVYNSKGVSIGYFERDILPSQGIIYNAHFYFNDKSYEGKGFGTRWYAQSEQKLKDYGVKEVKLFANNTIGGYAWARVGFSFENPTQAEFYSTRIRNNWDERYGIETFPFKKELLEPWEIASLVGPDGFEIGKDFFIPNKNSWDGVKILDESSKGFQVGQLYYQAKGIK